VYVPGSGSWCETFHSKEQYVKRIESEDWWDLRGEVSYPWIRTGLE
jgi:hypothetical protein